jgi:hypothetical protein
MYMMSWIEEDARVEASLGGRVTAAELRVLRDELEEVVATLGDQPFVMLLDYSRALPLDASATEELSALKDFCLEAGAERIVSVTLDDEHVAREIDVRLQHVLEGREAIVAQGGEASALETAEIIEFAAFESFRKAA